MAKPNASEAKNHYSSQQAVCQCKKAVGGGGFERCSLKGFSLLYNGVFFGQKSALLRGIGGSLQV
jgi:hypothetical protein